VNWLVDNSSKTIAFGIRGQADLSSSRCRRSSTYIGGDDSLATAWRDHDNPLNTFRSDPVPPALPQIAMGPRRSLPPCFSCAQQRRETANDEARR
jgi:hypothetical protein